MEESSERSGACSYRFGVICTNIEQCSICGFNPKEEALRSWTIRQQLKYRTMDAPYYLRIFRNEAENHE